ncbi:MAG: division/cell wall cluster transcriptional repressor MraZ [Gammaproteobacteria bacterium]|nr:division/cell wall cluster transcriptional repressor MraZ [Gammaproteobacteria bacterium]
MYRGVSDLSLDAKGRLAVPTRYRQALQEECGGRLVVTIARDARCLWMLPLPQWEEMAAKLNNLSNEPKAERLKRLIFGHATDCDMDRSGRVLLTPPLRNHAKLDKNLRMLGRGNKFEIWDQALWDQRLQEWLGEDLNFAGLPQELQELSL